jgi:hypothetical protein
MIDDMDFLEPETEIWDFVSHQYVLLDDVQGCFVAQYNLLHLKSNIAFTAKSVFRDEAHLYELLNRWNKQDDWKYWY